MSSDYWQLVSEVGQSIANRYIEDALDKIEILLCDYGDLDHTLYLKGVSLEQQGLSIENSVSLRVVSKKILSSQESTITHLDNAFRWFYLLEDWDCCCETLDRLLQKDSIPTTLAPGLYFKLAASPRRERIRELLHAKENVSEVSRNPFIAELKILYPSNGCSPPRKAKGDGPVILLTSDESIGEHFDAIKSQLSNLDYPTIDVDGKIDFGKSHKSQSDIANWLHDVNPLAIFIQTPYLETLPQPWQMFAESQPFCIPGYGPQLSGDDFWWGDSRGQFGLSGHVLARYVFAPNDSCANSFYDCGLSSDQVVMTGDPLTWSIRHDLTLSPSHSTFDLLWAPHWAPHNLTGRRRGYRNIDRDMKLVLQFAEEGHTVCFRPHPLIAKRLKQNADFLDLDSGLVEESLIGTWEQLISHQNVTMSSATMVEDCLRCNRLLTDGISIIYYWSLTGKPIAISSRPDSPTMSNFSAPLIREIPKLLTEAEIHMWLADFQFQHSLLLIERCNEIIPDKKESPSEIFLNFALNQGS